MQRKLSADNPFRPNAHAFLWEILKKDPAQKLLDFGAHDERFFFQNLFKK